MQETARVWLHCPSNRSVSGFRTVVELYLLHILVPLRYREEAEELILGEVGASVFTEDQRQTALELLEEKEQQNQELPRNSNQNATADVISAQGNMRHLTSTKADCLSDCSVFCRKCPLQS